MALHPITVNQDWRSHPAMIRNIRRSFLSLFVILQIISGAFGAAAAEAADKKGTKCKLHFSIHGWSALYETASGTGTVTCDNGQSSRVRIEVKGGGLTAGKSSLSGTGTFSEVPDISEVFGAYAKAEAHAGVVKSAGAQVMTKGDVSLALAAKGSGINLGIAFGKFRIDPAGKKSGK
jgi:hypothetical protein